MVEFAPARVALFSMLAGGRRLDIAKGVEVRDRRRTGALRAR
jgi:hypothetical protein